MYNYQPDSCWLEPQRQEGRTVPLINWGVEMQEGYKDEPDEWVTCHYVGGEDYEHSHGFHDTKEAALAEAKYLNETLPPQGYTHYYWSE